MQFSFRHTHNVLVIQSGKASASGGQKTVGQKVSWSVMCRADAMMRESFTSMKLPFHSLACTLRTAFPERLCRGHWNSTQRADPKRQSWKTNESWALQAMSLEMIWPLFLAELMMDMSSYKSRDTNLMKHFSTIKDFGALAGIHSNMDLDSF